MRTAIIGAGLAGLACAGRLRAAGHAVALFDEGRAAGGRMSSRRLPTASGEAGFDHGAQYFTARDPAFRARVAAWHAAGVAAPWPAAGPDAWVGTPAMNAPVRALACGQEVRWSARVDRLARDAGGWRLHGEGPDRAPFDAGPYDAVLSALPAEQAATLMRPVAPGMAARAAATPSAPCWTAMAAFARRLPVEPDVLRGEAAAAWAARNAAKPGRSGPEAWVIQAAPDWSTEHLEETPEAVLPVLLDAFARGAGIDLPAPLAAGAHRWRHARAGAAGEGLLWDAALGLGACGDWLLGPRVECAWLSGDRLGAALSAG